jgi:hypothetical protein
LSVPGPEAILSCVFQLSSSAVSAASAAALTAALLDGARL